MLCTSVCQTENCKDAAVLLTALAQPVLLTPEPHTATTTTASAGGKDTGIYMEERLTLRAQRELWSALVRSSTRDGSGGPIADAQALHLAHRFLECARKKRWRTSDPVSRSLAQMIVTASEADDSSSSAGRRREVDEDESLATIRRDAAFKETMRQLTFTRLRSRESLLSALSIGENGSDASDQRKVLMSFTRVATSTATPTTPQRTATRLHRSIDSRNDSEELVALRKNKRPRVVAEQGSNGSETQPDAPVGHVPHDAPMVVELPPEVHLLCCLCVY